MEALTVTIETPETEQAAEQAVAQALSELSAHELTLVGGGGVSFCFL